MSLIHKPTTEAMARANRANSQLSTGPATPAAKLNVRLNSLQHGLWTASAHALPQLGETEEERRELQRQLHWQFRPRDPLETALVEQMVENRWRRGRVIRAENSLLVKHRLQFDLDQERAQAAEAGLPSPSARPGWPKKKGWFRCPIPYPNSLSSCTACNRRGGRSRRKDSPTPP
jgi:hypothetical protein